MEYHEKQYFTQGWIKIIAFIVLLTGIGTSLLFIVKESDYGLASVTFIFCFLIFLLFYVAYLDVSVSNTVIKYKFYPFQLRYREISVHDGIDLEVVEYNPIADFGGWGIRKNSHATCYSTGGNFALKIKEKGKKDIYIGTLHPDKLKDYLSARTSSAHS
ncbi:MAG: hypothetical protein MUW56_10870 [Chryseobacterium sp.]|uniref:hypothetical protein n=1 Tax=Chryseobacterium sp. TaxID=1871047 RepID=UPI0025BB7A51|nr:hypothetical protein [Chryseobacterium sp.]MCJ7934112.1 hypothetical protein [Chryseobacterium sp.]